MSVTNTGRVLSIRRYEMGDEQAVVRLFERCFGATMSAEAYAWRFLKNPSGKGICEEAWDGPVLCSHCGVTPVAMMFFGEERKAGIGVTAMTDPDYRGKGLISVLFRNAFDRMAGERMLLFYALPTSKRIMHRLFVRDLGFVDIHAVPTLRLPLAGESPIADGLTTDEHGCRADSKAQIGVHPCASVVPSSAGVVKLRGFDERFDELWSVARQRYRIIAIRDRSHLEWRYSSHPHHKYVIHGAMRDGRLAGYAVSKYYRDEVDLVDMLSTDDEVGADLVRGVAGWAVAAQARAVNMWFNHTLPLYGELAKMGFREKPDVTYFGGRLVAPIAGKAKVKAKVEPVSTSTSTLTSTSSASAIFDFGNWYLTMGDSDVY